MKRLTTLVLTLLIGTGFVFSQQIPKKFDIPQRFENYLTKGIRGPPIKVFMNGEFLEAISFDINFDRLPDVIEFYSIPHKKGKSPLYYAFDKNGDYLINLKSELIVDPDEDGLGNGKNEMWLKRYRDDPRKGSKGILT